MRKITEANLPAEKKVPVVYLLIQDIHRGAIFQTQLKTPHIHQSPGIDDPIAMLRDVNGNGRFEENEVFTYTKDHLGSVKDITDVNAELKQRYGYTAYGITKLEKDDSHSSNKIIENPYAYTSREWEQETGCYYYRARWYCPHMEIFISEDPLHLLGGDSNLLKYVGRNPSMFSDSSGLRTDQCTTYFSAGNKQYPHVFTCVNDSCAGFGPASPLGTSLKDLTSIVEGKISNNTGLMGNASCKEQKPQKENQQDCFDSCNRAAFSSSAPSYQAAGQSAQNCERWSTNNIQNCFAKCAGQ